MDMPTRAQIEYNGDLLLAAVIPIISAKQENNRTNRGKYWQGGKTHNATPAHTTAAWGSTVPDRLDTTVGDVLMSWRNTLPSLGDAPMQVALQVDTYTDPDDGKGWVLTAIYKLDDVVYARSINVGPDASRETPWQVTEQFD